MSSSPEKYDLILLGATGFTGKLVLKYLLRNYVGKPYKASDKPFKFAICGRSESKLKATLDAARQELGNTDASSQNNQVDVLVADLVLDFPTPTSPKEEEANGRTLKTLSDHVKSTRVVASTAGPFIRYGEHLVRFCAEHGVDYTDITGETNFVRRMIDKYDDTARESGAKIVSLCAFDCSPWDLSVFRLSQEAAKHKKQLSAIRSYFDANSSISGGTIETMYNITNEWRSVLQPPRGALGFDPLMKSRSSNEESSSHTSINLPLMIQWNEETQRYVRPFLMSRVFGDCVKRSNALLNYSKNRTLTFSDAQIVPHSQEGILHRLGFYTSMCAFGFSFVFPPLQWALRRFAFPAPGEGPSEETMDQGFLHLTTFADVIDSTENEERTDSPGTGEKETYKCVMKFHTCPGYRDTARMLAEASLSLLDERLEAESANKDWKKARIEGNQCGVLSPAAAMGHRMLNRLVATGTDIEVTVA